MSDVAHVTGVAPQPARSFAGRIRGVLTSAHNSPLSLVTTRSRTAQDGPQAPERPRDLPLICAHGLTRAQLAGKRCAVPNCRRWLAWSRFSAPQVIGVTVGGRPVRACHDHDLTLVTEPVAPEEER